jgi:NAD(P)-dependent dehydrogenase (short-subunit alcohol dehydrogenase family)
MDVSVWDDLMRINLRGTMLCCKYAIPHLRARGGGSIINTASGAGHAGMLSHTAYGTSKAGVIMLTKYVATQHGKEGIRCNAISPGLVVTPATAENYAASGVGEMMLRHHLTPRLGKPEDIANAVVFLASDESAFVTGETLAVDGGSLAHQPFYADAMAAAFPKK